MPPDSDYTKGPGLCHAVHAETNAVLYGGFSKTKGATLYCTDEPCHECSRLVAAAGIARVVTPHGERVL